MSPQIGSSSMFCLRNSWRGISGRKGKSEDSNWTSGRCGGDHFLTSLHFSPMVGFNLKYLKQAGDVEETVFYFQEDLSSGSYNVLLAMGIGNPNQRGCHMSSCKQHCNQLGQIFFRYLRSCIEFTSMSYLQCNIWSFTSSEEYLNIQCLKSINLKS